MQNCGQINCRSDLGKHQDNCKNESMDKDKIAEIEKAIDDEFGDNYAISQKHLCYFNTFYQAVDLWIKNYDKPNVIKTVLL